MPSEPVCCVVSHEVVATLAYHCVVLAGDPCWDCIHWAICAQGDCVCLLICSPGH